MREVSIKQIDIDSGKSEVKTDTVAEERPIALYVNLRHHVTLLCSPTELKELAVGHVLSEGVAKSVDEIEDVRVSLEEGACYVKLVKGTPTEDETPKPKSSRVSDRAKQKTVRIRKVESNMRVKAKTLYECVQWLNTEAKVFRKTGGTHAAALFTEDGAMVAFFEDVGRHNAVDKVIGKAALNKIRLGRCFLVLSGRLTGEIVFKAMQTGLPLAGSLAAATDWGIAVADEAGITLAGFVRKGRMNIYTHPERIR